MPEKDIRKNEKEEKYVSPSPNLQAGGPHLVCSPRLCMQYIRSYSPYLEAVSSIRNPRTRHTVLTHNFKGKVARRYTD
jgi:hypothetical protein